MIIHTPPIIFIHIPKTGGTTIDTLLTINNKIGEVDTGFGSHHRLEQLYEKHCGKHTPPEDRYDLSIYHIFTVARNPWERYASLYIHDKFFWEGIPRNRKRTFITVEEYVQSRISENFFRAIEVNGIIPDNLMIINFDDFVNEVRRVFLIMGIKPGRIIHKNKKLIIQKKLQIETIANPIFKEAIAEMCAKEIKLFEYDYPNGGN